MSCNDQINCVLGKDKLFEDTLSLQINFLTNASVVYTCRWFDTLLDIDMDVVECQLELCMPTLTPRSSYFFSSKVVQVHYTRHQRGVLYLLGKDGNDQEVASGAGAEEDQVEDGHHVLDKGMHRFKLEPVTVSKGLDLGWSVVAKLCPCFHQVKWMC